MRIVQQLGDPPVGTADEGAQADKQGFQTYGQLIALCCRPAGVQGSEAAAGKELRQKVSKVLRASAAVVDHRALLLRAHVVRVLLGCVDIAGGPGHSTDASTFLLGWQKPQLRVQSSAGSASARRASRLRAQNSEVLPVQAVRTFKQDMCRYHSAPSPCRMLRDVLRQ